MINGNALESWWLILGLKLGLIYGLVVLLSDYADYDDSNDHDDYDDYDNFENYDDHIIPK